MTRGRMTAELKAQWLDALRSGRYTQATHYLKIDGGFCCLGVLCDIQGADFDAIREKHGTLSLSSNPREFLAGLEESGITSRLSAMNDDGKTFEEIADYIEASVPVTSPERQP
jgi:hypothetical protein